MQLLLPFSHFIASAYALIDRFIHCAVIANHCRIILPSRPRVGNTLQLPFRFHVWEPVNSHKKNPAARRRGFCTHLPSSDCCPFIHLHPPDRPHRNPRYCPVLHGVARQGDYPSIYSSDNDFADTADENKGGGLFWPTGPPASNSTTPPCSSKQANCERVASELRTSCKRVASELQANCKRIASACLFVTGSK